MNTKRTRIRSYLLCDSFAVFAALREVRSEYHAKLAKNAKEDAKEDSAEYN